MASELVCQVGRSGSLQHGPFVAAGWYSLPACLQLIQPMPSIGLTKVMPCVIMTVWS